MIMTIKMIMMMMIIMIMMIMIIRVQTRKKKWWWPFFTWSLSIMAINAWRLRQKTTGETETYLHFIRELVMGMVQEYRTKPIRRRSLVPIRISNKER